MQTCQGNNDHSRAREHNPTIQKNFRRSRTVKAALTQKRPSGYITIPDFKANYRARSNKIIWYRQKATDGSMGYRIDCTKISTHLQPTNF